PSTHAIRYHALPLTQIIKEAVFNPDMVKTVSDAEVHHFKLIEEFENRFLKVVLNPEKEVIVTFHFDRRLRRWK
ncbi:MAG: hypothetical protein KAW82_00460, partial [Desulfurellaceae bacterium]|nr:hypothetical protein [Desulfurellaceae bacterium]